ncbi:MAG: hypothetical protein HRU19_30795 [Pseudobacteriovorax sp.]|nr:hypothetical protein [Pseudobacteriovorax sp.]
MIFSFRGIVEQKPYGHVEALFLNTHMPLLALLQKNLNGHYGDIEISVIANNRSGAKRASGPFKIHWQIDYKVGGTIGVDSEFVVAGKDVKLLLERLQNQQIHLMVKLVEKPVQN